MKYETAGREAAQRREDETIYCDAVSYVLLWSVNQIVQQAPALVLVLTAFGIATTSADEPMSAAYLVLVPVWLAALMIVTAIRVVEGIHWSDVNRPLDIIRSIKGNLWKTAIFFLSFVVLMDVTARLNFTDISLEDQIREGDTRGRTVALVFVLASLAATSNFNISDRLLRTRQLVSVLTAASLSLVASLALLIVFLIYNDVPYVVQMVFALAMLASCYAWHAARRLQGSW